MIDKIRLSNFRNFKSRVLNFSPQITVVTGPNASGKTNLLEAVYLLATGKSFKAGLQEEMISYDEEIARVKGKIKDNILEVVLTRGEITLGQDPKKVERVPRKRLLLNNVGKRLIDFAGQFRVVLFAPQDLDLVTESPALRRKFLDAVLSQTDREYYRAILSYEKGLRQRNKLLWRIREEGLSRSQLLFWNRLLIKNGDFVSQKRQALIDFINSPHQPFNSSNHYQIKYDKSAVSEARFQHYAQEEIAAATTLVGPHRDDFCFYFKKHQLDRFGSRGEQRMGVLWLKLGELVYVQEKTQEKPTLLLDDIFSELDQQHRKVVTKVVKDYQTIITTTEKQFVKHLKGINQINLVK